MKQILKSITLRPPLAVVAMVAVIAALVAPGSPRPASADPTTDVINILAANSTGGTLGVYLRQIDGPVLAAQNENFVFEPASTIKALIHFHAMRQVQDDPTIDLDTQVPWFTDISGSCPQLTGPASDTLEEGLFQMMWNSDNRWTQAMRDFFGDASIDATRQAFNMPLSRLSHLIGCFVSEPPDGSGFTRGFDDRNILTLVEAGRMYEAVATGFLDDETRADAFSPMTKDNGDFNQLITDESAGLGLSTASITAFRNARQSANKAGSYGGGGLLWRSVAGWAQIPWKDSATCEVEIRQYVYGAFIDGASSLAGGFNIRATAVELFRDEIGSALESWVACEADLEVVSSTVVAPPTEMDVNTSTGLTVDVTVRNNGPATVIDGVLTVTPSVPADCSVAPASGEVAIPTMQDGVSLVRNVDFTVECSDPSFHQFLFNSAIAPAVAAVVDPNPTNNMRVTGATVEVIALADLSVAGWDFSELDNAGITDLLVGGDFFFDTTKSIHNAGDTVGILYHDPVDTTVTRTFEIPDGVRGHVRTSADEGTSTITIQVPGDPDVVLAGQPAGTLVSQDGPATIIVEFRADDLAVGETRAIVEEFGLQCLAPGEHELGFINSIGAVDIHVIDPDESNNTLALTKTIECITPVQINIRPGNQHNQVNTRSQQVIPVAVLTTDAGEYGLPLAFDATAIDRTTARFGTVGTLNSGGGTIAIPDQDFVRDSFEMDDKTKDGDLDRVMHFDISGTGADSETTELCVIGKYVGGDNNLYTFFGCDWVHVQ